MTINLHVVLILVLAWLVCCATGYGAAQLLLPDHWHLERLLLTPVFGSAVIIFLSSMFSYAGLGMRTAALPIVGIGITLSIAVYFSKSRPAIHRRDRRILIFANLLGLAAGLSALGSVILYNAWNPYNDAFTYCSIADYLQHASYFKPADPDAYYPVLTQMLLYQRSGLRMGANFLLGFFTALFRNEYSFDTYMPVLALGLWMAVPSLWVLCRRALFMPIAATAISAVFYALHLGIPITNALRGFLPETWGIAFMLPLIALHVRATSRSSRLKRVIGAGVLGGIALLTYTEIVPFALLAIATCYLVRLVFGRLRFFNCVVSGLAPVLISVIIAPIAAWTFAKVIATQIRAVVGSDVKLHALDYVVTLAGFKPGLGFSSSLPPSFTQILFLYPFLRVAAIIAFVSVLYACFRGPLKTSRQAGYISLIFLLVLAWFSLCARNPWNPAEIGQPWSTYKAVTYGFFLFAAMWGMSVFLFWNKGGVMRLLAVGQLAVFLLFFPFGTLATAEQQSRQMREFTGVDKNPISEYERLPRVLAGLPANTPVNLIFPPEVFVHQRWVAYFLRRPVIAKWSEGYISPYLDPKNRALNYDLRYPSLVYNPLARGRAAANLTIDTTHHAIMSSFGAGWYNIEHNKQNWWRWLRKAGEIRLFLQQGGRVRMRGEIAVVGVPERTISVRVVGHPELTMNYAIQKTWFTPFISDALNLPSGDHQIIISASGPTSQIGNDLRKFRIGVRNVSWEWEPPPNSAVPASHFKPSKSDH
jgi:hypothetical protein